MLYDKSIEFTKENIDNFLKEVAKDYRKQVGKYVPAEMILIGGAAVLLNYGFRNMTTDIDALIHAASAMKDSINFIGDRYGLPNGWLNDDFTSTASYTPKLYEYSKYYRTFSNVLTVRTVDAEYLVAMKLKSGRQYKNDLSDVLGILEEHRKKGNPLALEDIKKATENLYGEWESLPETSRDFIENVMRKGQYSELYSRMCINEKENRELLHNFEQDYPGVTKQENADIIAETLREKKGKESVLAQLRLKSNQTKNGEPKKEEEVIR